MTYEALASSLDFEKGEKEQLLNTDREISEKFPNEYKRLAESYHVGLEANTCAIKECAARVGLSPELVAL